MTFVLSIFEWSPKTGFTVPKPHVQCCLFITLCLGSIGIDHDVISDTWYKRAILQSNYRVPTSSGNPGKSLKVPCMEKSWN